MKEHIKRRIEYSKNALPEKGSSEYDRIIEGLRIHEEDNPDFKKKIKQRQLEAIKRWELQESNGIGLLMDPEIRHYLGEFNHRSWSYGHRKMPMMFNVMEAFFHLDKRLNYWRLLDEEDFSISFFDFIDYYTSNEFKYNLNNIRESLEEDLIYNFNVGYDLKQITFKTVNAEEFVIAGVSLIRRGNEVTMLFNTGQIIDTKKRSNELLPLEEMKRSVGKEMIDIADNRIREAVKLNDDPDLWKILIACRFDLESQTIDARYIAKDEGNSFTILTDDLTGFMVDGEWRDPSYEETYKNLAKQVEDYNSIFELAKACLFLPDYFNFYDDEIEEKEIETEVKNILKSPFKKREFDKANNKFKIRNRTLWILCRNKKFSADRIKLRDDNFKIESSGYWKKLNNDQIGTDKKGNPIEGKTWVNQKESYYVAEKEELIVGINSPEEFDTENAGRIYIMRNANLGKNVYKIGLTTNKTEERANQLSKTSIPDKFYVMREWNVKDCYLAEKKIHEILHNYRVDKRREFFELDMQKANDVIDSVINKINEK